MKSNLSKVEGALAKINYKRIINKNKIAPKNNRNDVRSILDLQPDALQSSPSNMY